MYSTCSNIIFIEFFKLLKLIESPQHAQSKPEMTHWDLVIFCSGHQCHFVFVYWQLRENSFTEFNQTCSDSSMGHKYVQLQFKL